MRLTLAKYFFPLILLAGCTSQPKYNNKVAVIFEVPQGLSLHILGPGDGHYESTTPVCVLAEGCEYSCQYRDGDGNLVKEFKVVAADKLRVKAVHEERGP